MDEKEFALRLAALRTKKNVSAREMSLAIGQNQGYINHIENGTAVPSLPVFFYICDYLGITPGEFFNTDVEDPSKLAKINEYLKKLDTEQLDIIENLLKNMVGK